MHDYRADVAKATGDDRWLQLTDSHARLYRVEECRTGRVIRQADERNYISDADLSRMLGYIELLGLPRDQAMTINRDGRDADVAGLGQPAMMRAWLIQALTGRRASEKVLMDFEPLTAIPGVDPATVPEGGMVARLRYQQTKVDGAPPDHPGRRRHHADHPRATGLRPRAVGSLAVGSARYLFPRLTGNRKATRAWETESL